MSRKGVKLIDQLIANYGQQEGKRRYQQYILKKKYQMSQQYYVDKYGHELGKQKYREYLQKTHFCNSQQRFIRKFGQVLGKQKWQQYRKSCARTKQSFIAKYGQKIGLQKWQKYRARQSQTNTFQYKQKIYGWTKQKFKAYNLSRVPSLQNYQKKYGIQLGQKKYSQYLRKRCGKSQIAKQFFLKIVKENKNNHKIYFNQTQKCIAKQIRGCYFLDFFNQTTNKAIEFYGDFWHCSQLLFQQNQINEVLHKTAREIRQKDKKRIQYIQSKGISVKIFWQHQLQDIQKIQQIIDWVYEN